MGVLQLLIWQWPNTMVSAAINQTPVYQLSREQTIFHSQMDR